jgi:hypothetical protein
MAGDSPTLSQLRTGATLGAIVHATTQTTCPLYLQGWSGSDYLLNDCSGTSGAVTFFKDGCVGAFYDVHSKHPTNDWLAHHREEFFAGMPATHRVIAEQFTLQYLLQEHEGSVIPLVTAVFWNQGEDLTAAVPWPEMIRNGGHILENQLMDTEAALAAWEEDYQMTAEQLDFVRRIFRRRTETKIAWMELSEEEAQWLQDQAESPDAMKQCRQSFAEISIFVPCVL